MLVTDDAVWVGSQRSLLRLDPATGRVTHRVSLDGDAGVISTDRAGAIWVHLGDNLDIDVDGIDPGTNRVVRRVTCACWVLGSTSDGSLWAEVEGGLGPLTLPKQQSTFARVHDVVATDTEVLGPRLVDDTFWWTRTLSASNVPVDGLVEVLNASDVANAVRSGFATPAAAATAQSIGPYAVHDGTAWFIGWRRTIGFRLYHWSP